MARKAVTRSAAELAGATAAAVSFGHPVSQVQLTDILEGSPAMAGTNLGTVSLVDAVCESLRLAVMVS
jgi:hypothetical protein